MSHYRQFGLLIEGQLFHRLSYQGTWRKLPKQKEPIEGFGGSVVGHRIINAECLDEKRFATAFLHNETLVYPLTVYEATRFHKQNPLW